MECLQNAALPLHIQKLEQALNLDCYLHDVHSVLKSWPLALPPSNLFTSVDNQEASTVTKRPPRRNGYQYNFTNVAQERQWIKDLLLSESDDSTTELSESEQLQMLLVLQYKRKKWKRKIKRLTKVRQYQYMSAGLLLHRDRYPEIHREEEKKRMKRKRVREDKILDDDSLHREASWRPDSRRLVEVSGKDREAERAEYQKKLWSYIAKKEIPRMAKLFSQARHTVITNNKKIAMFCQREVKRWAVKSQRQSKEASSVQPRARRVMREMLVYWRKHEKVEKEQRRKAEREAMEQHKLNEEMREAKRQQRKLNFLITQTELYAHFMAKKLTGEKRSVEDILSNLDDTVLQREIKPGVMVNLEEPNEYDSEAVKAQAVAKVQSAVERQKNKHQTFVDAAVDGTVTDLQQSFDDNFSLANPAFVGDKELPQPSIFRGQLKVYQLKGMNWLASLYNQGINGILADEMGLGKTVQSIALLASLCERQNIWGPFLVVSPASTLHNWQQECTKFVPSFKVLPYWGSPHERKVIRKYWNQKLLSSRNSPFHILITSYQLVVQDFKYFQRVKWQYMILDEAQAIKSSSSVRWKMLMSFNCRNRLLLTGTPIQNTMAELWALLHFIMPTMFDSHEEFNEWFSRDIESHAEKKSALDENQLSRLHMILKPFMLRRIKKDVEHEMAEKIEVHLTCGLSIRQKKLYYRLRERISIDDLLCSSSTTSYHSSKDSTSHLMNLVMQFRKVCNHPDLFERRDVHSPLHFPMDTDQLPRLIYHEIVRPNLNRLRLLRMLLGIHCASHVHLSALTSNGIWVFLHLCGMSVGEAFLIFNGCMADSLQTLVDLSDRANLVYIQRLWKSPSICRSSDSRQLLLWPSQRCSAPALRDSKALSDLVFTGHASTVYTHTTHTLLTLRHNWHDNEELSRISSTVSSSSEGSSAHLGSQGVMTDVRGVRSSQRLCAQIEIPKFLLAYCPKALAPPVHLYVSSREAEYRRQELIRGGPHQLRQLLQHGVRESRPLLRLGTAALGGFDALLPPQGWSHIHIAHKEMMITDSGKMAVLDKLLVKLKREGHRVLVYSQMTRMIDLLEEFMAYRRYRYIRLDGSSRISDRRDMVDDFQTKSDIFVFLLSTRAGGLGINLTAADTVIFYDSDWNPTVDQQAMDRAHRLGQTKQVTVYRLIVKGSIEERILQRAHEKSEIQKMVISGGDFKSDALKPKEVVSLLLDDEEMESRFLTKQAERKAQEEQNKKSSKPKKKRSIQKSAEGTPPAKVARVSISPSPSVSRPGSVISHSSDLANGELVDVVGVTAEDSNGVVRKSVGNVTPTRTKKSSRSSKRPGGSSTNNRMKKRPPLSATANITLSQSPSSLSNFSIPGNAHSFGDVVNNGGSSHSSPQSSPFPSSLPVISVTPPSHCSTKL